MDYKIIILNHCKFAMKATKKMNARNRAWQSCYKLFSAVNLTMCNVTLNPHPSRKD